MFWLYIDTGDSTKVSNLSSSIFWLVLPSLTLFLTLPDFAQTRTSFLLGHSNINLRLTIFVLLINAGSIKLFWGKVINDDRNAS